MNIQPSIDLKKVNLQTAVGYLVSLHENEYQWNLLGVRVVGVAATEADIPDGTYEYGDAYEVGTEPPYDLYIYTRPDGVVHTEGYWFNTGKFPMPGPQGPKGDGWEQVNTLSDGSIKSLSYYPTSGADITSNALVTYKNSTTGQGETKNFTMFSNLPIIPGKYISMNATSGNKKVEVKVDGTALSLDYIKIDKTKTGAIPQNNSGTINWIPSSTYSAANSLVQRNGAGDANFHKLNFEFIGYKDDTSPSVMYYYDIYNNTKGSDYLIEKTPTNRGTLTTTQLTELQNPNQSKNLRIVYDNQVYYRINKQGLPYLKYVHLDLIEDGTGGYKLIVKIFNIVSTGAWQIINFDFGGSTRTTHNLTLTNSSTGMSIYFSLTNNRPETYEGAPAGLIAALGTSQIACTVDANGTYSAGMITTDGTNFQVTYGKGEEAQIEQLQVGITDNLV